MSSEERLQLDPADCIPATNLFDGAFDNFKQAKESKQPTSKPKAKPKAAEKSSSALQTWDGGYFLSGNPRCEEMKAALELGGVATRCYLACCHLRGMTKKDTFRFPKFIAADFWEITDSRRRQGLEKLESAGLITVERQSGAAPLVTMIWR